MASERKRKGGKLDERVRGAIGHAHDAEEPGH